MVYGEESSAPSAAPTSQHATGGQVAHIYREAGANCHIFAGRRTERLIRLWQSRVSHAGMARAHPHPRVGGPSPPCSRYLSHREQTRPQGRSLTKVMPVDSDERLAQDIEARMDEETDAGVDSQLTQPGIGNA